MDYMQVYTPYTMSFVAAYTLCIMLSALFSAYIAVKVKKDLLFFGGVFVQAALLAQLLGKLLELVSPTQEIAGITAGVQKAGTLFLFPALALFLFAARKRAIKGRLYFSLCAVSLASAAFSAACCLSGSGPVYDSAHACAFLIWNLFMFRVRKSVFAELSEISIDGFMERLEDAILIFDSGGKLMDCNESARSLFPSAAPFGTLEEFYIRLNSGTALGGKLPPPGGESEEPAEISLGGPWGIRHYLYGVTVLKNRKNEPAATILTFHDVTEKADLLRELERKNEELGRLNKELKRHIGVTGRLADETERNRAALEIQNTIGIRIEELLRDLQALESAGGVGDEAVSERLAEITENCRRFMAEIRESVKMLLPAQDERG